MKIEDDTCFVKSYRHTDDEFVFLSHFIEVWDNGYSNDVYTISNDSIYFEDASHNGVDPDSIQAGTYIMKKQYLRWTQQIQHAKETVVKMLQHGAMSLNRPLEVGDIILYTWIDDEVEHELREENAYYAMRITKIKNDYLFGQCLLIDKHSFNSIDENEYKLPCDIVSSSCFITTDAFLTTNDYMRSFCSKLLDEIKCCVHKTELI